MIEILVLFINIIPIRQVFFFLNNDIYQIAYLWFIFAIHCKQIIEKNFVI
jgi:hypothetical protein